MSEIELKLLPDFIVEASEHLEEMESLLLDLVEKPEDLSILNEIFRPIHTIKGSAQYIGIARISSLAHKLEDLLDLLREGKMASTPEVVEILISARDRISLLVKELEQSQREESSVDDIIKKLAELLGEIDVAQSEDSENIVEVNSSDDEIEGGDEEDDKELFEIFINQLIKEVDKLKLIIDGIDLEEDKDRSLMEGAAVLEKLISSSNYMGYQDLNDFYSEWLDSIKMAQKEVLKGKDVSLAFMGFYLAELKQFYPQLNEQVKRDVCDEETNNEIKGEADNPVAIEENDGELYEIFIKQLKREYDVIKSSLITGNELVDKSGALYKSSHSLEMLKSSVNYMGYEDVAEFYQEWLDTIRDALRNLEKGKDVALGFMDFYIAEMKQLYPVLNDQSSDMGLSGQPADIECDSQETKVDATYNVENNSLADGPADGPADNSELFGRLSDALDVSMKQVSNADIETLHDVYDELVTAKTIKDKAAQEVPDKRLGERRSLRNDRREMEERRREKSNMERKSKRSIRVDSEKIDALMNQVGELVVDRSYFVQLLNELGELQQHLKEKANLEQKELKLIRTFNYRLAEAISGMGRTSNELQEGVMKMRMLPISQIFNRYPRLIHDLTSNTDKKVNLVINGEDTELDKMIVEELSDPLVHIIRNAVDHGIEALDERKAKGKEEIGTLKLEAYQESNNIVIEVTDDGRGIDNNSIKRKALEKGLFSSEELDAMSPREVTQIIMTAGFSTADKITGTSGRGVGMDVVRKNIEKLNGNLEIESKFGIGTQMRLKIPLTLAIIHALMIRTGSDMYAIPLANVDETVRINVDEISFVEGVEVISLREQTLPIFRLSKLFGISSDENKSKVYVVIVSSGGQRTGFVVDELMGQDEVVIKPLVDYVQEKSGFSGATIIGDGRISLILDVYELVRITANRQAKKHQDQTRILKSKIKRSGSVELPANN